MTRLSRSSRVSSALARAYSSIRSSDSARTWCSRCSICRCMERRTRRTPSRHAGTIPASSSGNGTGLSRANARVTPASAPVSRTRRITERSDKGGMNVSGGAGTGPTRCRPWESYHSGSTAAATLWIGERNRFQVAAKYSPRRERSGRLAGHSCQIVCGSGRLRESKDLATKFLRPGSAVTTVSRCREADMAANRVDDSIRQAAAALAKARRVAVLSGAGASAESGVPTFRASDGLWEGHRIEDVASPDGFRRDPKLVWNFYNGRRANVARVRPNLGHHVLAELEPRYPDGFTLVTQNVDGLHQAAGSRNVLEVHGSLRRTRCTECGAVHDRGLAALPDIPTVEL